MFSQGSKPESGAPSGETRRGKGVSSGEPSVISADLKITGNLESAGDLQIKGRIEGDVKSRSVSVGEGAHVQGTIVAEQVQVSGAVTGQIQAPSVTLAKSAKMLGDIVHESLSIEAGAHMEGQCRRLDAKKAEAPPAPRLKSAEPAAAVPAAAVPAKRVVGASS
jgi:cytoskeletal protein CcmA (bactofilin family)